MLMALSVVDSVRRAQAQGLNVKSGFTGGIRQIGVEYLRDGDIILFKEDFQVVDQPVRRGSTDTYECLYVDVKRGGSMVTVPMSASFFWKTRQVCGADKKPTGEYRTSNGEVVDFIQNSIDLNEAIKDIARNHPNGVKVTMDKFPTLRYGEPEDGTGRTQEANIPTLTWA